MVRVLGKQKPYVTPHRRIFCPSCGVCLQYVDSDEKLSIQEKPPTKGRVYIVCPSCLGEITLRSW